MTEALLNHLWQSTLFACAAALLTLVFRRNGAGVRFSIWLVASLRFLVPFPLLVLMGEHLHWSTPGATGAGATPQWSVFVSQIVQPASALKLALGPTIRGATTSAATTFAATAPQAAVAGPTVLGAGVSDTGMWHWGLATWALLVWSIGCAVLVGRWLLRWLKLRAVVATAVPLDIEAPIPVRETATTLEPGVCGIFTPVLLLPRGIATRLTSEELDSMLEHELCHWWRKDNLAAALHMLVEVLFWFHPMVWWLGSRMIIERERACDEQVIQSGIDRQVYAEGILKVCRLYVEPPLLCATGISGGTLRERIEDIMTNQATAKLDLVKKCLLSAAALAAVAVPVAIGMTFGSQGLAQAQAPGGSGAPAMRHYQNTEWNFALDVPKGWNRFPPNLTNSPSEVMRFASGAEGTQLLIIFRNFFEASKGVSGFISAVQQTLEKGGFTHFVTGEITVGSRHVITLDFDRPAPDGSGTWSCRQYIFVEGTLLYTLGFGTNSKPEAVLPLYDRVASSFTFDPSI
jgi:beta-lactamase regulating signal transducer with metallopeptidase domain